MGGSCSFPHVEVTAPALPQDNLGLMGLLCKGHRGVMRVKTVQNDAAVTLNQMSLMKRRFKSGLWERKSSIFKSTTKPGSALQYTLVL